MTLILDDLMARRVLYEVVKSIKGVSFTRIYDEAFTDGFTPGKGYESNFSAGKIGIERAAQIAAWLKDHHPEAYLELTSRLDALANPPDPVPDWEDWIARHGRFGVFDVALVKRSGLSIVSFASTEPLAEQSIRLGQSFVFRLKEPLKGSVLAFQSPGHGWYPLPLHPEQLQTSLDDSEIILPIDPTTREPMPLSEDDQKGRHRFVFLVSHEPLIDAIAGGVSAGQMIPPAFLNGLAQRLEGKTDGWSLYRLDVLFVD